MVHSTFRYRNVNVIWNFPSDRSISESFTYMESTLKSTNDFWDGVSAF